MKGYWALLSAFGMLGLYGSTTMAQQELEPGVQTSPAVTPTTPPAPAASPSVVAPAPVTVAKPGAKSNATLKSSTSAPTPGAPKADKSADRVDLNATQISGNRELPKVMYVVPWRKAELGEFAGRPPNSLLDEALTPIDRDVFKRQNRYFETLQQQAGSAKSQPEVPTGAPATPRPEDEK